METTVTIDLFDKQLRVFQVFQPEDYESIMASWDIHDPQLANMLEGTDLAGVNRWCDLTPLQYRFLIVQGIDMMDRMPIEQINERNDHLRRLRFFIGALLVKITELTGDHVDMLRIQHLGNAKINFETMASQAIRLGEDGKNHRTETIRNLRVVVDNTKSDE